MGILMSDKTKNDIDNKNDDKIKYTMDDKMGDKDQLIKPRIEVVVVDGKKIPKIQDRVDDKTIDNKNIQHLAFKDKNKDKDTDDKGEND